MVLQNKITLKFTNKIFPRVVLVSILIKIRLKLNNLLLLSRALPFLRRKVYAPVGSFIPVTLLRIVNRERRISPVQGLSGEIRTLRTVYINRRNIKIFSIKSF